MRYRGFIAFVVLLVLILLWLILSGGIRQRRPWQSRELIAAGMKNERYS